MFVFSLLNHIRTTLIISFNWGLFWGCVNRSVFALRREDILRDAIHTDQVGFVSGGSSCDNLRRLLHLMWLRREDSTPVAALCLGAGTGLHRVELRFLVQTLECFELKNVFLNCIRAVRCMQNHRHQFSPAAWWICCYHCERIKEIEMDGNK